MRRRHARGLALALACTAAVSVLVVVPLLLAAIVSAALATVAAERVALEARLDRVHGQGMAAGEALCRGFVPESQRPPQLVQLHASDASDAPDAIR